MATTRINKGQPLWLLFLVLFALIAAACGGSDDDAASNDEATTESDSGDDSASEDDGTDDETAGDDANTDDETAGDDAATDSADDEPLRVAYLSASSANTWLLSSLAEMEKIAAAENVEIVEFDAQFDPSLQATQFQDVIAAGDYDGVILVSISGVASAPDIQAALDAGLEVVLLNQVVGEDFTTAEPQVDGVSASVMAPPFQNGKRLGQLTVQACADLDPCEVVYIYGIKGTPIDDALRAGLDEVLADHPAISVVAEGEGQYLGPEGGINATQDIIQIAPDFNVLVGADQSVQGAEIVLGDEGKLDQVSLIGLGGSEPAIAGISSGAWFGGVFGAPGDEGRLAMEALMSALTSGPDIGGVDPLGDLPDDGLITVDNVSSFTAQWAG